MQDTDAHRALLTGIRATLQRQHHTDARRASFTGTRAAVHTVRKHRCSHGTLTSTKTTLQRQRPTYAPCMAPEPRCRGSNARTPTNKSLASEPCCRGSQTQVCTRHCSLAPEPYCRGNSKQTHANNHSPATQPHRRGSMHAGATHYHKSHAAEVVTQTRGQGHLSQAQEPCCRGGNA